MREGKVLFKYPTPCPFRENPQGEPLSSKERGRKRKRGLHPS
jgi:hypothetical protein